MLMRERLCDRHLVSDGVGDDTDAEEGRESSGAGTAAVEAEQKLVEVGLDVRSVQAVTDAERQGFQVGEHAARPR